MSLKIYLNRLKYVDHLISQKATGNVNHLAGKLDLSRSQTLRFIREMKEQGFPIKYLISHQSYYYTKAGRLVKHLFEEEKPSIDERYLSI